MPLLSAEGADCVPRRDFVMFEWCAMCMRAVSSELCTRDGHVCRRVHACCKLEMLSSAQHTIIVT